MCENWGIIFSRWFRAQDFLSVPLQQESSSRKQMSYKGTLLEALACTLSLCCLTCEVWQPWQLPEPRSFPSHGKTCWHFRCSNGHHHVIKNTESISPKLLMILMTIHFWAQAEEAGRSSLMLSPGKGQTKSRTDRPSFWQTCRKTQHVFLWHRNMVSVTPSLCPSQLWCPGRVSGPFPVVCFGYWYELWIMHKSPSVFVALQ